MLPVLALLPHADYNSDDIQLYVLNINPCEIDVLALFVDSLFDKISKQIWIKQSIYKMKYVIIAARIIV